MKKLLFWAGVLISVALLALALRGLRLDEFAHDLQNANLIWLLPGIALYFVSVGFRSWRWSLLLRPLGVRLPTRRLFPVVVIGYMGNNVYPARIGEVLRAWVLRRNEGVPMSSSLATVGIERVLDGLLMVAFVVIGLPAVPGLSTQAWPAVVVALLVFGVAIGIFLWMAHAPAAAERIVNAVAARFFPERFRGGLVNFATRFIAGAGSLRDPAAAAQIIAASAITWLIETGKYACVAHAFGLSLPFVGLMLINGVSNLFTVIPGAPGAVGTFDAGGILAAEALGVEKGLASAYVLVLHVALWLPVTLLGAYFMVRQGVKWADLGRMED
ncbi:MAG: lysylphosphatidylglycerol synthase transmembrane domain-containing protein [Chloroflexi bacterium]|nr:lysylphosphatidylglycerol synthase transmembrane domain-containing protein [Chloroflexota bacterium]